MPLSKALISLRNLSSGTIGCKCKIIICLACCEIPYGNRAMLLLIQPVSQAWAVKGWWEKSDFCHSEQHGYGGDEHTSMALGPEVAPGLSRCNPDWILLFQTNSTLPAGTSYWVLSCPLLQLWQERLPQPGYRVCRALLVCSCGLCFMKWREEDFNDFLQGNEIILLWEKYCQPTCCLLQPSAVQ